ncbi:TetR/AcrR family transcriptional regulator [Streptomyces noursei]|uniref:TetR family transcriptional regulator n=1 Tax=Streptomyces noursei TaxID=1971 RepID=A0A059VVD8_STRNR|nr:TetR/AcrR family transcriptional regulator [Streptomyces noursei]AIA00998.1 TetR family transcriptional regulator [Streptomyces noursei]UWS69968.1 TetR family transcriptional regulator [Streptomyces noursei]GCB88604.1 TetR family transcriptional regulator [Streptomyces noursei]
MSVKAARAAETREAILAAAERLFAEHGVFAVSNRQISEAAGQGNNAAVGYHFGTKTDLIRAVVRRHADPIDALRQHMLATTGDSRDARDWVACLVRPGARHLGQLGSPTWYARFAAQLMTDPVLREVMVDEAFGPSIARNLDGLNRCLPDLPLPVRIERGDMARHLMVHTLAERERALADGTPTVHADWDAYADGLIDAITGLWLAPCPTTP